MKKLFLLYLLVQAMTSFAQNGSISGILKFENDESSSNVMVLLKEIKKSAVSDSEGKFTFTNVPYGNYTLEFSSIEIESKSVPVQVNAPTLSLPITLVQKDEQLKEVVIKKESIKKQIEEKGFAVNVIETKEAGLRNLQTMELLNRTVGVRIRQNGGMGSDASFNINGMSGNAIKIFIDGIPASSYGSSFDLNSIPPAIIERIEVYKGVLPGHLSDDALGGAINVILKKGMRNNFNISASYGSFNTAQTNFSGLYRFEKSGFTVKASGFLNYSDNDYEVWGKLVYNVLPNGRQEFIKAKRFNDTYRSIGGVVELGYTDVKWADNFFIGFTTSDSYQEVQHGVFMTTPYKGRFTEADAQLLNLAYNKKDFLIKGLDFDLHGIYGKRNRMVNDTVSTAYNWNGQQAINFDGNPVPTDKGAQQGPATIMNIMRNVFSLRAGLSYSISDNHKILLNNMVNTVAREDDDEMLSILERRFMGTRDMTKNISSLTYEFVGFDNRLKTSLFGKLYQQNMERMNPVIRPVNGVDTRVEDVSKSTKKAEGYGAAFSFAVLPNVTLLTSAEKAVRLPNENEVFGDATENTSDNPNLRYESSENFNLGFRLGAFKLNKHSFFFAANGFVRDIKDRIGRPLSSQINNDIQVLGFVNQGNAKSKGFDFEFNYTFNNNFNLSFNTSKLELTTLNRYNVKTPLPNEPFLTINVGANYMFKDVIAKKSQLNVFYSYLFVDTFNFLFLDGANLAGADFFDVPQQNIHDIGLSYVFPNKKFIASFDAKNITNRQVYDNMGVQKPGRAFYFKLNYVFNNF